MESDEKQFDPVSLGILWNRLVSITDEIESTLVRTSFSTIVSESFDLTVVILDRQGRLVAQGSHSIPVFIGTAPRTLGYMLQKFPPESLSPGDVICTNDPWMGTGHLFDINVMRPVFKSDGELVGYTMSITHLPDIGGIGFGAAATQIYHEGLRLPIVKLVDKGKTNAFILDLLEANVRTPESTIGDLIANITCNEVGGRQLLEFMDEYSIHDLTPLSNAIRAQSEVAMRKKIREITNGSYHNKIMIEAIDEAIPLECTIEVKDESIDINFQGTGGCVDRGINVPFCYTNAMSLYSIKCITIPSLPNNEGASRPISVSAPEGCLLNAQPPYPTGGRHAIGHFVPGLIFGALAGAAADKIQADNGMIDLVTVQGTHPDGRPISTIHFTAGGFGALEGLDGRDCLPGPSNMATVPVEIWETITGMTVVNKKMIPDSGGPGTFRGGLGQEVTLRNDTGNPMTVLSMANRTEFPAPGYNDGHSGTLREHRINGEVIHPKGAHTLKPLDTMTLVQAGGGGIGDPANRPRKKIQRDLSLGLISKEGALRDYGYKT
jgi:N-methylhydantoinase B